MLAQRQVLVLCVSRVNVTVTYSSSFFLCLSRTSVWTWHSKIGVAHKVLLVLHRVYRIHHKKPRSIQNQTINRTFIVTGMWTNEILLSIADQSIRYHRWAHASGFVRLHPKNQVRRLKRNKISPLAMWFDSMMPTMPQSLPLIIKFMVLSVSNI